MLKLKYLILVQLVIVGFILATARADEEISSSHYNTFEPDNADVNSSEEEDGYLRAYLKRALPRMGKRAQFDNDENSQDQEHRFNELYRRVLMRMGRALPRMGRALPRMGRALPRMG